MKQVPEPAPKPGKKNNKKSVHIFKFKFSVRDIFLWVLVVMMAFSLFSAFQSNVDSSEEVPISQVIQDVKEGEVDKIVVEDVKLKVTYKNGEEVTSIKEPGSSFNQLMVDAGIDLSSVQIENVDITFMMIAASLVGQLLPILFIFGLLYFLYRQTRGAQDTLFNFGRSGAKLYSKKMPKVTFKDVAGVDEAKEEMKEVVDFLKSPKRYLDLGARTPKGVLLVGPAGTGKTLLAKAVAGEAGVPFFSMAGSEFMEMLVGIGAKRVRDLFNTAKKNQPSIIFIDEVDAIGRRRSTGVMGSHDEREQTLNQILVEMDGFDPRTNVIVIAATNRGDLLDPALLRPGRFDRRIVLDFPDIEGRKSILSIHAQGKPFAKDVDWHKVAKRTVGFSGADLENMLNEAAIMAARGDKKEIDMKDIEEAATKVKLGPEKKRLQTDQDRKMTAYHEAGHAVVTYALNHMDAVHRISIVSRGMSLGYTLIPPERDRLHETKSELLERIAMMMGGRAAEEIVFGDITSGAANDFDQATHVARLMVEEYGMSEIGPVNFGPDMDITDYNKRFFERDGVSPAMQEQIDKEVQKILIEGHKKALEVLKKNRQKLDKVADALVDRETIEGDEFEKIMGGKKELTNN
ncbi:ATP-dependent metallopeptidase FtsH/Yme1/Tma family protein [Candidatus Roizmanbacteria bacterium]|nr:ATP-dependent metallopeptidase FtsH/Yme1/Tma family protein [Candidatus Roizmanbacteria bacterium]